MSASGRKQDTITFQPLSINRQFLNKYLGEKPKRGAQTKLINNMLLVGFIAKEQKP